MHPSLHYNRNVLFKDAQKQYRLMHATAGFCPLSVIQLSKAKAQRGATASRGRSRHAFSRAL